MAYRKVNDLWVLSVLRPVAWLVLVAGVLTGVAVGEDSLLAAWLLAVGGGLAWLLFIGIAVAADLARSTHEEVVRARVEVQEERRSP